MSNHGDINPAEIQLPDEEMTAEINRLTIERDEARLAQAAIVAPTTVKLPPFWPAEPRGWFIQADAQFDIKRITSDATKYSHLVASLDKSTVTRILDWLDAPPPIGTRYKALKDLLMGTLSLTRRERAAKILDMGPLGDETASERYDRMRALRGSEAAELLWEEVFLRQLPDNVQAQLANDDMTDMKAFAKKADGLLRIHKRSVNVCAAQPTRARSPNPKPKPPTDGLCWAHRRFGKDCNKCRMPNSCKMANVLAQAKNEAEPRH